MSTDDLTGGCPNCGAPRRHTEQRIGPDQQFPGAETPYRHCNECGEAWEDNDTFRARAEIWATLHRNGYEDAHTSEPRKEGEG